MAKKGTILSPIERPFTGANQNRVLEAKKMIAFRCPEGTHDGRFPTDIEACKEAGHNPYFTSKRIKRPVEKIEERDGKQYVVGTEEEIEYVLIPNWEQVVYDISIDSGQLPAKRTREGWVYPEELGYAPFCDYYGCSMQNPKFVTQVGTYHHRDEAALIYLTKGGREDSDEGTAIFVNDTTSGHRRRLQIDEVAERIARG